MGSCQFTGPGPNGCRCASTQSQLGITYFITLATTVHRVHSSKSTIEQCLKEWKALWNAYVPFRSAGSPVPFTLPRTQLQWTWLQHEGIPVSPRGWGPVETQLGAALSTGSVTFLSLLWTETKVELIYGLVVSQLKAWVNAERACRCCLGYAKVVIAGMETSVLSLLSCRTHIWLLCDSSLLTL